MEKIWLIISHQRFCGQNLNTKNPSVWQLTLLRQHLNSSISIISNKHMSKLSKILLTVTFYSQWSGPSSFSTNNNLISPPLHSHTFSSNAYKASEARFYTP